MKTPALVSLLVLCAFSACSSAPPVRKQAYASLSNHRTYEHELPVVWKAVGKAVENYKVTDRDETELETDWIYAQSRDKYVEYRVNDSPRRKALQTRFRFKVQAARKIASTDVTVKVDEEIERLKQDGTSAGYESVGEPDPSRANELLDRIGMAILSSN